MRSFDPPVFRATRSNVNFYLQPVYNGRYPSLSVVGIHSFVPPVFRAHMSSVNFYLQPQYDGRYQSLSVVGMHSFGPPVFRAHRSSVNFYLQPPYDGRYPSLSVVLACIHLVHLYSELTGLVSIFICNPHMTEDTHLFLSCWHSFFWSNCIPRYQV